MTDLQKLYNFLSLQIAEAAIQTQEDKDLFNERAYVLAAMTLEDEGVIYEDGNYPAEVINPMYEALLKSIIQNGLQCAKNRAAQAA